MTSSLFTLRLCDLYLSTTKSVRIDRARREGSSRSFAVTHSPMRSDDQALSPFSNKPRVIAVYDRRYHPTFVYLPQIYFQAGASSSASSSSVAAPAAPARKGEYRCEACSSENTSFDIIGGASDGSRKGETFGRKDAPELVLRVSCLACGNSWIEER